MPRPAKTADKSDTREKILDVALDLFVNRGFYKTSLREIAEQLGVTKAALYYHFASKEDILLALHIRFHNLVRGATKNLAAPGANRLQIFADTLRDLVDEMINNERLFMLHERNRAAFEKLHESEQHENLHGDLEMQVRDLLGDTALPARTRVRMACALGALVFGVVLPGNAFADIPRGELGRLLREAQHALLDDVTGDIPAPARTPPPGATVP